MIQTAELELLRALPTEKGSLELQYCWRHYQIMEAADILGEIETEEQEGGKNPKWLQ